MKRINLWHEVYEVVRAIEGARVLIDAAENDSLETDYDATRAPRAASAILNLATARLENLCRALHGEKDPADLAAHFNAAEPGTKDDVLLHGWPTRRRADSGHRVSHRAVQHDRSRTEDHEPDG